MDLDRTRAAAIVLAALTTTGATALAIQSQEGAPPPAGPEHRLLLERVGTWDGEMRMWPGPGDPVLLEATEVVRPVGDLHVVTDFEAETMGMPFVGHGVQSWDPVKERYVSLWVDSVDASPAVIEGTYDEATRTLTFAGEARMMGQAVGVRQVYATQDADHRSFELYFTPPGGEETRSMRIEYVRRG